MSEIPRSSRVRNQAGVLVPLFSIPSRRSWGIGEIADLPRLTRWLESAGLDLVQLLPVNEMAEGQNSPYSALSAMAIDPLYIALADVPDFAEAGGEGSLTPEERRLLERARAATIVDYAAVRVAKRHALQLAFETFSSHGSSRTTRRTAEFDRFREREAWWLDDYALFRALHDENGGRYWIEWSPPIRNREPPALDAARERLAPAVRFYEYLQWIADEQWQRARREAAPIEIFGDFPFAVSGHSADVWARQHEFELEASVGVPPDAFSETGQNWGLPLYRWEVIERGGYEWLRQRARRSVELFDGFRVDHLVGFYRTYAREPDGSAYFVPAEEPEQLAQGERILRLLVDSGARILAEDLGTVPDFVRESLARLQVPGMKVLRWEREWNADGKPFRDPAEYPVGSVAISGTHDTDTLAEWWDTADLEERRAVLALPGLQESGCRPEDAYSDRLRDALLTILLTARSSLVLLPIQDIFGWRDRVNVPASVDDRNWTWRLPWPVEDLTRVPEAVERARFLRRVRSGSDRL